MTPEPEPELREALLAAVPSLRAFAISLSGQVDRADDLVQDTLLRALANLHRFEPGTNLNAWLFTILRNLFHSEYRKRRREVEDPDGSYAGRLKVQPEQGSHLDFEDFRSALAKLPARSARGPASGRGLRLFLRGDGTYLRLRRRHHQEPRQPRALPPRLPPECRGYRRSRPRQHDPGRAAGIGLRSALPFRQRYDLNKKAPPLRGGAF